MIIIQIAGRLGRDPESRFTPSGQKVTNLTVAVNIRKGGKEETTVWWRVTVWGDRFDKMMPYFKKGSAIIVVGEMTKAPEIWTDKEGRPQTSLELTAEIIRFSPFGSPDKDGKEQTGAGQYSNASAQQGQSSQGNEPFADYSSTQGQQGFSSGQGSGNYSQSAQSEEQLPF